MDILCSDLEGVFVPEIWINVAERTGIEELRKTTRDIPVYEELMDMRLAILDEKKIKIQDITDVIAGMEPLEGALDFLNWVRKRAQVIVVSDTFEQFAGPLMGKLGWPTLFCNRLEIDPDGKVTGYKLRQKDGKRKSVLALKSLEYTVTAFGDSYNDISMLKEADTAALFRPPENVISDYPEFPVTNTYDELKEILKEAMGL